MRQIMENRDEALTAAPRPGMMNLRLIAGPLGPGSGGTKFLGRIM
ncbi:hypothetical protein KNP414_02236 [Paenibacillus mucilaginosus KNP414]|uniref:Uncharacterized protein n=1 Tax=Paenibacillus mucilaginosus (strain KNP414) TaxID=1036673 RepID=F8F567_PAEMK|nr:hypothetical protein KNP414_02236 [Paenibacillus mucilaginosus KNP414]